MKLVVGLGNPSAQYARTRHNVGFRAAEFFAARHRITLDSRKWNAVYGVGAVDGEKVAVLEAQTFMNLTGEAVGPAARFFKVAPEDVIALHDELDLPFGRLQLKKGGGAGGHNGLKSLVQHLGGPEFVRLRIGISRPPPKWDAADYVLSNFTGAEEKGLDDLLPSTAEAVELWMREGLLAAMNRVNRKDDKKDDKAGQARES